MRKKIFAVSDIHGHFTEFKDAPDASGFENGNPDGEVKTASPDDMLEYYSKEEQQKYGVVGIEIELCEA